MPIITPAYPSMCATHNVTSSTKKIILREMRLASEVTNKITDGKLQWNDLFAKHSFFTRGYKYYLSVIAASRTKEAQLMWSGLVESKVRRLVSAIEQSQAGVELAHPFNKGFERVHRCRNEEEVDAVLQGNLQYQANDIKTETTDMSNDVTHNVVAIGDGDNMEMPKLEIAEATTNSISTIYTTTYYVGIELAKGSFF